MKGILGALVAILLFIGITPVGQAAAQSTNNFTISSFDIQYELSRTSEGRSVLKTTETITAEFPQVDQNHGLERAIPLSYDGHSTKVAVRSVTNQNGESLQYSDKNASGTKVLRIGDPDEYVHGTQTYVITYEQQDVTRFFADTGKDEWYWDTNGVEWKVPIQQLTVLATFKDGLADQFKGEPRCYVGGVGSTELCSFSRISTNEFRLQTGNLAARENVTVAYGFEEGTFSPYEQSLFEKLLAIWLISLIVTSAIGLALFIALSVIYSRRRNRTNELEPVAVEYIPPKGTSVLVSAQVKTPLGSVFGAQLIDLAVRHFIAIIETKPKSTWQMAEYDIKILKDPNILLIEEQELLSDMFSTLPKVGDTLSLKDLRSDYSYTARTLDNDKKLKASIEGEYAVREKNPTQAKLFYKWAIAMLVLGIVTLSPLLLVFAGSVALLGHYLRPLTDKGLALRRYLFGLDKYIKAAEAERLAFFQGPDTAHKVGEVVDTNNPGQMLKLYERVLPYAILFGREKEWTKRLGDFYATSQTSPDWYIGTTAFNAALFSSSITSFSQSTSYSAGSSSSSGGSSGGGSSGGGGGGGGGGGW